jgi:hypothetical protein
MYKNTLFLLLCAVSILASAQPHATGLIWDNTAYSSTPLKATLTRGLYNSMPSSASLKQYCPSIGDQGNYGTCVGWSCSYSARTILWARQQGITNTSDITTAAFSPGFLYRNIVTPNNYPSCSSGAKLDDALECLKQIGDVLKQQYDPLCPNEIDNGLMKQAESYRIENYAHLFDSYDAEETILNSTKKALSEGNPVVIGMVVPESFQVCREDLWTPTANEQANPNVGGGHAMCVIGYDNNKYGGAFEIMNSWGEKWGNKGFVWVKYNDYARFTRYAFEMINNINPTPAPVVVVVPPPSPQPNNKIDPPTPPPTPKPQPNPVPTMDYDFAGDMRFVLKDGTEMKGRIEEVRGLYVVDNDEPSPTPNRKKKENNPDNFKPDPNLTTGKFIAYRIDQAYSEGTQFRVYLRNNEAAYVYAISMDGTNNAVTLFPHKPSISPILNYKKSEVAMPSESSYIVMDDVKGTDIFCLLYSKEALDIESINRQLEQETGTFFQRLYKIMKDKLVHREHLRYYNQRMRFEVKSYGTGTVVPIVVELPHN